MSGSAEPIFVDVKGARYQVFVGADNKYYLYDPNHQLDPASLETGYQRHVRLPGADDFSSGNQLNGLGSGDANAQTAISVAATAATFVPVVGPVLGPLIGAIGSMFTGGDPTPGNSIWKSIIDEREMLAQLRNQLAGNVVDTFVVPAGFDRMSDGPNGGNTANVLATKICNEILNLGTDDIHKVKRATWYKCRDTLAQMIKDLQAQLHDQQLTQSIVQSLTPATPVAAPVASPPDTTTIAPITAAPSPTPFMVPQPIYQPTPQIAYQPPTDNMQQMLPYIMVGGMVLAAVLITRR